MESGSTRDAIRNVLIFAALLGGLYALSRVFDIAAVQAYVEEAGVWAPLVLAAAKATTIIIAPLSGSPLYPIGGALFGFWKAFAWLMVGDTVGAVVAFWISRFFGRAYAERMIGKERGTLSDALEMMGTKKGFFLARLCFAGFPEISAYGAGLTKINFVPFIFIHSLVGIVPVALTTALGTVLTGTNSPIVFGGILLAGSLITGLSFLLFAKMLQRERARKASAIPAFTPET